VSGDTLQNIASLLSNALRPFLSSLGSDEEIMAFVEELGWTLPLVPPSIPALANSGNAVIDALADAQNAADKLDDGSGDEDAVSTALIQLVAAFGSFAFQTRDLRTKLAAELPAPFLAATDIAESFPKRLFEDLFVREIATRAPFSTALAVLAGLIEEVEIEPDPAHFQPAYTRRVVHLNRISVSLNDPGTILQEVYGWGTPTLDIDRLFMNIRRLSYGLLGPLEVRYPSDALLSVLAPGAVIPDDEGLPPAYTIPIYEGGPITIVLALIPLPKRTPEELQGVAVTLSLKLSDETTLTLIPSLTLTLDGTLDLSSGAAAVLRPDRDPALVLNPEGIPIPLTGKGGARLSCTDAGGQPTRLLTFGSGSFLEATELYFAAGLDATARLPDLYVSAGAKGGKLVIGLGGADNFLASILPKNGLTTSFDFGVEWSQRGGLRFSGGASLGTSISLNATLGPFSLQSAHIEVTADSKSVILELSISGGATIGPIHVLVERLGVKLLTAFQDGNLGPIDLALGFKPPNGVGLSLDVGGFKGGGFLMLDSEKGEYAGALELDFKGLFSVKAIGIINTKMPDGSKGFSLLIVITAEFTPIQLSFGFTLNGVGGIFGLNRMINVAALADGIRTNAVKSILFPEDVIANITRIISDIKQFFPPQQDHFVIGPMAKLGWGTPSIITVELGLLLDLPNPMFAIVGVLKAMLPAEDAPLLRLQVNFIGIVDFDRGYIFFRADLFDSRLLVYSITGSMAFLVSWGEAQTFALSVGGFHPDFRDIPSIPALPDGFRNMARIGLSLLSDDNPRLKVESYFAVTSNTVQFGARVELYASAGGFNIYGFLGYDVLFQFDPFRFLANISGGVALRRGTSTIAGINVSATLSGPTPWDARGKASISFFFFSISVGFHVTWGDPPPAISPATEDLLALLQREFNDTRNWRAELPPNNHLHVSLRKIEPPVGQELLVIHPAGVLTFSQRSLPLEDYLIQKFGNKKPLAQNKFKLSNANSGGPDIPADYQGVREQFAPGNFTELSDSEKLSRRSFEKLPSGFKLTATKDLLVATPVTRSVVYELSYLRRKSLVFKGLVTLVVRAYDRLVKGSSVRQSTLAHQQNRLSLNAPKQVILSEEGFAIASTADLKSHLQNGDGAVVFATQAEAYQRQSELIAQNPSLAGSLQVVSNFELNLN